MTIEYTAAQAAEDAIKSNNEFLAQELTIVINTIKISARQGKREIPIKLSTHKNTLEELRKRCFIITTNNNDIIVSW